MNNEDLFMNVVVSAEDESVEYAQFDNVRFIFRDGEYVGWYAC